KSRCEKRHSHCHARHQVGNRFFIFVIQKLQHQEKCHIPQKRIEKYGPVKLKTFQRRQQCLKQPAKTFKKIHAVNHTVKDNEGKNPEKGLFENFLSFLFSHQTYDQIKQKYHTHRQYKPG